jgi:DNA-directed RNA polymerase subunit RPC12/RpoP
MALFQCRKCGKIEPHPRLYTYNFGPFVRCPRCGTQRLSRLQSPDRIDRFHRSAASALNRMLGGSLFHCRFCRIQFYDRRPLKAEAPVEAVAEPK